jgi:hypothetical protein
MLNETLATIQAIDLTMSLAIDLTGFKNTPITTGFLLLELGDYILLENDGLIELE